MNIAAKKEKILEHIALEAHIACVSREASRKGGSVTAVYNMNDPLPMPPNICDPTIFSPVQLHHQDKNVPKLSPENIELMKMQQFHQQQLQQKYQMYLAQAAQQAAHQAAQQAAQQSNGFFLPNFVPFTQQPMIRPNFYLGQPIQHPFGRDVPGMREVRSSCTPPPQLMSLNGLWTYLIFESFFEFFLFVFSYKSWNKS